MALEGKNRPEGDGKLDKAEIIKCLNEGGIVKRIVVELLDSEHLKKAILLLIKTQGVFAVKTNEDKYHMIKLKKSYSEEGAEKCLARIAIRTKEEVIECKKYDPQIFEGNADQLMEYLLICAEGAKVVGSAVTPEGIQINFSNNESGGQLSLSFNDKDGSTVSRQILETIKSTGDIKEIEWSAEEFCRRGRLAEVFLAMPIRTQTEISLGDFSVQEIEEMKIAPSATEPDAGAASGGTGTDSLEEAGAEEGNEVQYPLPTKQEIIEQLGEGKHVRRIVIELLGKGREEVIALMAKMQRGNFQSKYKSEEDFFIEFENRQNKFFAKRASQPYRLDRCSYSFKSQKEMIDYLRQSRPGVNGEASDENILFQLFGSQLTVHAKTDNFENDETIMEILATGDIKEVEWSQSKRTRMAEAGKDKIALGEEDLADAMMEVDLLDGDALDRAFAEMAVVVEQ